MNNGPAPCFPDAPLMVVNKKGKDAMSRISLLGLGLVMLGAMAGCHHVAGICDCDKSPAFAHGEPPLSQGAVITASAPVMSHAEAAK
jgi:hypothetical protein